MEDIKSKLMANARSKGICIDGYKELHHSPDVGEMVDYYVANPDWCLERNFPDLQTLTTEFANFEHKGVYVNKVFDGELLNDLQTYVFHNCSGTVRVGLNVGRSIIPMMYVANGCNLEFIGYGDARPLQDAWRSVVPIYVFGDNEVTANDNEFVLFNLYENELI